MFKRLPALFVVMAVAVVLAGVTSVDAAKEPKKFGVITAGCFNDSLGGFKITQFQQDDVSPVPSPLVAIDDTCAEFTRILLEQGWKLEQLGGNFGFAQGSFMVFTKKL